MATATLTPSESITIEEYLRTTYNPDCDFVDGHLEERHLGEYEHSTIQTALGAWFFSHRSEWKIRVASEYRTRVAPSRIRIPDVSVFSQDGPVERIRITPPLIAIEILSPEDRLNRVIPRLDDYLDMGVKNVWVIDPVERVAFDYSDRSLRLLDSPMLIVKETPIFLDLREIFSALD